MFCLIDQAFKGFWGLWIVSCKLLLVESFCPYLWLPLLSLVVCGLSSISLAHMTAPSARLVWPLPAELPGLPPQLGSVLLCRRCTCCLYCPEFPCSFCSPGKPLGCELGIFMSLGFGKSLDCCAAQEMSLNTHAQCVCVSLSPLSPLYPPFSLLDLFLGRGLDASLINPTHISRFLTVREL